MPSRTDKASRYGMGIEDISTEKIMGECYAGKIVLNTV
jgi:hypothetical protein